MDRRFQGKPFPNNIVFLAACNPFRTKKVSDQKIVGLKKLFKVADEVLAFKVKFPPLAMISIMWDFQQLKDKENYAYISKMLESLDYEEH